METLVQHHFVALMLFGAAAFMLGIVARAVGDHLLGTKRDQERELRDALWRKVELELEMKKIRETIKSAPESVRTGAFELAFSQARRWSEGMVELARQFGEAPEEPVAEQRSAPHAPQPTSFDAWKRPVAVARPNGHADN